MRIGFLIDSTGFSQMTMFIAQMSLQIKQDKSHVDCCLFPLSVAPSPLNLPFALIPAEYAWSYPGVLVATSFETAKILLKCRGASQKIFYVWDFDWIHNIQPLKDIDHIYNSEDFKVVVRSQDAYDVYKKCWRKPDDIIEEFDYERFKSYIK